jgi:hypothetical protein
MVVDYSPAMTRTITDLEDYLVFMIMEWLDELSLWALETTCRTMHDHVDQFMSVPIDLDGGTRAEKMLAITAGHSETSRGGDTDIPPRLHLWRASMRSGRLESFIRNVRDDLFPDDQTTTSMEAPHQYSGCHDAVVDTVSQRPKTGINRFARRALVFMKGFRSVMSRLMECFVVDRYNDGVIVEECDTDHVRGFVQWLTLCIRDRHPTMALTAANALAELYGCDLAFEVVLDVLQFNSQWKWGCVTEKVLIDLLSQLAHGNDEDDDDRMLASYEAVDDSFDVDYTSGCNCLFAFARAFLVKPYKVHEGYYVPKHSHKRFMPFLPCVMARFVDCITIISARNHWKGGKGGVPRATKS